MKTIGIAVLLAGLVSIGCALGPKEVEKPPQVRLKMSAPPVVMPDEVTEANAVEMMKMLKEEIEYDRRGGAADDGE